MFYLTKRVEEPIEWRNLSLRPESVDFREMSQEEVLVILWKCSNVLIDDKIPSEVDLLSKAREAIMKAKPYNFQVNTFRGKIKIWYFKKWIEDFNGKKIKTDLSDPRCVCPIWYDEINNKRDYTKKISKKIIDKKNQRHNIISDDGYDFE